MNLKKILALLVAAVMLLAMSATALADTDPVRTNTATTMNIPVTKTVYFYNADGAKVYEPKIVYEYSVRPATPAETTTVTDAGGDTANVKPGDMRAFGATNATTPVTTSVSYNPAHAVVNVPANGIGVTKGNSLTFNSDGLLRDSAGKGSGEAGYDAATAVVSAGIYRYVITETTTEAEKNAVGIVEGDNYDKTLILDVYVKSDGTVSGAVIHDPQGKDDPSTDDTEDESITPTSAKTTGFGDGNDPTGDETPAGSDPADPTGQKTGLTTTGIPSTATELATVDSYTTYNVTVSKTVAGDMGDKSHKFPFSTQIASSIGSAAFTYYTVGDTTGVKKTIAANSTISDALKDGESFKIEGLPTNLTTMVNVVVTETNNTNDTYTTTAKLDNAAFDLSWTRDGGSSIGSSASVAKDKTAANKDAIALKGEAGKNIIAFTNTLNEVSPTGVVLRFAPYFAMMAGGTALFLVLFLKRRKNEEEEEA